MSHLIHANVFVLTVLLGAQFLSGCASSNGSAGQLESHRGGGIDGGGLPNPASKLCDDKGGKLEMYTDEDGQTGFCNFGRAIVEEWTLFRYFSDSRAKVAAVDVFLKHPSVNADRGNGGANPASMYCVNVGGTIKGYQSPLGTVGICAFPDNTMIEEWTLFRGPSDSLNKSLVKVLKSRNL